jgi:colanic acid biosynthesis glycosyl transferase WcaI
MAHGLPNICFGPLARREDLGELLGLATVHLLPQLVGAADLLLPSKLTNMLASGRPVIATAGAGTGLSEEVRGCGLVTPAGDAIAFAHAITELLDDPVCRSKYGLAARARAEKRWSRDSILCYLEAEMKKLTADSGEAII